MTQRYSDYQKLKRRKPVKTPDESKHSWQTKFCPLLTMAEIAGNAMKPDPAPSGIVASGLQSALPAKKAAVEAQPCQGHNCMLFVSFNDDAGKPTGDGACSLTLSTSLASQQVTILGAIAAKITGAAPTLPSQPH